MEFSVSRAATNDQRGSYYGACTHLQAENYYHIEQVGVSACGLTSLLTALLILGMDTKENILGLDHSGVILRRRKEEASLPVYLLSRYDAGCTGTELVTSMQHLVKTAFGHRNISVSGEFLEYKTLSNINSIDFLASLLEKGKVIIATINLQLLGNDAWHHQVVYGVDTAKREVYCMNPICTYSEWLFEKMLTTPSVLMIRRQDVLMRLLFDAASHDDECFAESGAESIYDSDPWKEFNVKMQIEKMQQDANIQYLIIPAAYKGGFAVFSRI